MSLLNKLYPEDSPPGGGTDWTLMYGDLMTLLLTFFVMLVSMSELKHNEKFQSVADSMAEQFGGARPTETDSERLGRSAGLATAHRAYANRRAKELGGWESYVQLASMRAMPTGMLATMDRDVPAQMASTKRTEAANGSNGGNLVPSVAAVAGPRVLAAVQFLPESADLTEQSKQDLREVWESLSGQMVRVEIRGMLPSFVRPTSLEQSLTAEKEPLSLPADESSLVLSRATTVRDLFLLRNELTKARVSLSLAAIDTIEPGQLGSVSASQVTGGTVLVMVNDVPVRASIVKDRQAEVDLPKAQQETYR